MAKIIIVEDDPMISEIYQKKFTEAGFEVLAAMSGEQALVLAKNDNVDAVLSDLIMPKMDGFEVIKRLRGGAYNPNIKIIVTSNLSQKEDRDKAMKLGANGFISKADYTPTDLVVEVNRLLGQYREQQKNEKKEKEIKNGGKVSQSDHGKKILMIEDEDIFIDMFGGRLKKEGYNVTFARNGAWGVKEAFKEKFDLFIIDMVMPAMTGKEMVERLKMEEETKNIPIIVFSASADDQENEEMKKMGVNEFLEKTQTTPTQLVEKIQEQLNR